MQEVNIIEEVILDNFPFSKRQICSRTRKREIVVVRQIWQTMLSEFTKQSTTDIGLLVGDRDHATVMHSRKTIHNLCETDKRILSKVDFIRKQIQDRIKLSDDSKKELNDLIFTTEVKTTADHENEISDVVEYSKIANIDISKRMADLIVKNKQVERLEEGREIRYKLELFVAKRHELKAYVNQVIQSMPLSRIMEIRAAK